MKSKPYRLKGKLFRYDFDRCLVEYIFKATAKDRKEEEEWKEKFGVPLLDIDEDGYVVLDAAGLSTDNWKKRSLRDEYLSYYCNDLEAESEALVANFVKYELPHMN